jgi:hypothetical protein
MYFECYSVNPDGSIVSGLVDEHDKPITRTPTTHPYSYDGFITWRGGKNEEANNTIYSDRLWQWDHKKTNKLCEKHFGDKSQYFNQRTPEQIEAFLRDYTNNPNLKLIFIMEYCHQSSGYPIWRFEYHT